MSLIPNFLLTTLLFLPLLFFVIAAIFRLMDNSSLLFLQKEILVNSSNVSRDLIRNEIKKNPDIEFTRRLKRVLIFRRIHRSFMILMIISCPVSLALWNVVG